MEELAGKQEEDEAFWMRGMVAKKWTSFEYPSSEQCFSVGVECGPGVEHLYIDGSGDSNDVRRRRCGWGVAWLDGCCKFAGGMFGRLGDEKHTVAKAELAALLKTLELLKRTGGDGGVTIWTDCRYVSEGVGNAVWSRSSIASHGDKWVGLEDC